MTDAENGLPLKGKVAIVTGSVAGIGRATALALGRDGASVVVNGRRSVAAAADAAALVEKAGGRALVHMADVSEPAQAARLVAAAVDGFGRLDILVNNVSHRIAKPIEEIGFDEWRDVQASTLDAAFLCIRAAVPHIKAAGGGSIVNIGGVSGHAGVKNRAAVAAAKAGLAGMTAALAVELGPANINVNCVSPGSIDNYRSAAAMSAHFLDRPPPMGRMGRVDEVPRWYAICAGRPGATSPGRRSMSAGRGMFRSPEPGISQGRRRHVGQPGLVPGRDGLPWSKTNTGGRHE